MQEQQYEFEIDLETERIEQLLQSNNLVDFREEFLSYPLYEQAQIYRNLNEESRLQIYSYLSPQEISNMFEILEEDIESIEEYLLEMNKQYAADMLGEMYTDNAVDMLQQLPTDEIPTYLRLMDAKQAKQIREIIHYEDETAGSIMTTEYVSLKANQTVRSAMAILKSMAKEAETIYYTYVINTEGQLVGVLSLRDLIISNEDVMIRDIMSDRVVTVNVDDDQADVAHVARDYDFLALPVIDENNVLLGIITVDDIMDVMHEEATSDYSGLAAVDVDEVTNNPFEAAKKRLPWLITLLFLGMGTSSLISNYEGLISEAAILSVFVTLITGTAGNAGTQSLAVAVRKIGQPETEKRNFSAMILQELLTGLISGLVTGITIMIVVGIWKGNFILGAIIGFSMLMAITVANLAGSLIPILMDRLGFDPAVASGPFISTFSDLTSVLIYFSIAQYFLSNFL
ncbi:Magnesium transporter MgtE [Jeotgalibaca dankookensis]|uniref:Magnesium transporter MgtE n=1 Tax=Jeotgalibaca dankookensis TaxID=708126 RepID=A0A1S6IMM0_9LACT|nr:magnesium transporter [Jeotgalibaca dankookensis]AQS52804.1 Magnesium transporter MgtE [Jeotgalibaca dankookensis]